MSPINESKRASIIYRSISLIKDLIMFILYTNKPYNNPVIFRNSHMLVLSVFEGRLNKAENFKSLDASSKEHLFENANMHASLDIASDAFMVYILCQNQETNQSQIVSN